jgi:F-type H+-transporting ATPase subunit b
MKKLALVFMLCSVALFAQEPAEKKAEHKVGEEAKATEGEGKHEEDFTTWKWVNFFLLAGGLGYLIGKSAPKFFKDRTDSIQKDMAESAKVAADAEARVKAVELQISKLGEELARMKAEVRTDMARESERLQNDSTKAIERISSHAEQEVELAAKVEMLGLKQYAAQLAVDLAEQRIRTRLNSETQGRLVDSFVQDLGKN